MARHIKVFVLCFALGTATASQSLAQTRQGSAQTRQAWQRVATAIAVYEATQQECVYAEVVGEALAALEKLMSESDPALWQSVKRQMEGSPDQLRNAGRVTRALDGPPPPNFRMDRETSVAQMEAYSRQLKAREEALQPRYEIGPDGSYKRVQRAAPSEIPQPKLAPPPREAVDPEAAAKAERNADCKTLGFAIGDSLFYAVNVVGPNPALIQEMDRLAKGGGEKRE